MEKWIASGIYKQINIVVDVVAALWIIFLGVMTYKYWVTAPAMIPVHFDEVGSIDNYLSKDSLFIIVGISIVVYIILFLMSTYLNMDRHLVRITSSNRDRQYNLTSTFIKVLNLEAILLFASIQIKLMKSAWSGLANITDIIILVPVVAILITTIIYVVLIFKEK
ncbi:MAG: DUF1648 domain-containing protein [Sarcina sp.]